VRGRRRESGRGKRIEEGGIKKQYFQWYKIYKKLNYI